MGVFGAMGVVVNIPEGTAYDAVPIFYSLRPDAVFLGTSSPVNGEAAECAFLKEANNRSLPAFIFADTYGAEVRLGGEALDCGG